MITIFRDFSPRDVCISIRAHQPLASGTERTMQGDIIAVRRPGIGLGMVTMSRFLYLLVEGLDAHEMWPLKMMNTEPLDTVDSAVPNADMIIYEKRRYCIPLHRLKGVAPFLDLDRVRDHNDIYQPFLNVDEDNGFYLTSRRPLNIHGLVYDKALQRYL